MLPHPLPVCEFIWMRFVNTVFMILVRFYFSLPICVLLLLSACISISIVVIVINMEKMRMVCLFAHKIRMNVVAGFYSNSQRTY